MDGPHRIGQREVAARPGLVFDHGQHDGRRADLQQGGDLGQIGVADDDVESAEPLGVGVGLVPGIDDRALQGRLEPDDLLEEFGPLGDLEVDRGGIERRRLHPDLARAGEDGARDEVRHHAFDHPGERDGPVHHVVLVAAVGVALAVGVVLVDDRRGHVGDTRLGGDHGAAHDLLAGLVIDQAFERGQAFGGGVLRVGMVDVEAGAVGEDGVGQVGLDHRGQRPLAGEAAGVVARRLVLEVPPDPLLDVRRVGVDQHRGGGNRILLGTGRVNAVLGLDPADLDGGHASTLGPFRGTARYPPARSTGRR